VRPVLRLSWTSEKRVAGWLAAFGLGLMLAAPADAVRKREEENPITNAPEELPFKELDVAPPAFPQDKDLIEFTINGRTQNRYFVDGSTLSVDSDAIIRFVLEVRTPSGVRNVTFSGVRCETLEWKDYAFASPDRSWRTDAEADWNYVEKKNLNNYKRSLVDEFLCLSGVRKSSTRGSAKTIVRLLKNPPEPDNRTLRILR